MTASSAPRRRRIAHSKRCLSRPPLPGYRRAMLDEAHLALMPSRTLVAELRELAQLDPRISALARAQRGTPDPAAVVTLMNDAGETVFEMVEVPVPGVAGRLFVGQLPGRASKLAGELDALVAFGIRHVFSLLPAIDLADLYRVPTYVEEARTRFGERFVLLDVVDYEVPPDEAAFEAALGAADRALVAGDRVYVHCGAGCGRTGVFASCLLGLHGAEPLDAIGRFRAVRGCGPETPEQVAYVVRHAGRGLKGA
jgi:protein-tyrosine phosphatase